MAVDPDPTPLRASPVSPDRAERTTASNALAGCRIAIVGRLAGMSHREAAQTIRRYGGTVVAADAGSADLTVIGEARSEASAEEAIDSADGAGLPQARRSARAPRGAAAARGEVIDESQLWQRLGLIDQTDVRRLYTPTMLAELLKVPVAFIRRFHRQGALEAVRCVRRLPYFDFAETAVARKLANLHEAGCSPRMIDRRLARLGQVLPELQRPLADPRVVVQGRNLYLRRGEELAEPGGQLLLDFDMVGDQGDGPPAILSLSDASPNDHVDLLGRLRQQALDCEDAGDLEGAAESYRSLLAAGGPTAEIEFALADVLYRLGDLSAARERYYAAIELDEEYVEARFSLGCVLAETGELELAVAALEGTLAFHLDYADAHFHLARTLERLGRTDEAAAHYTSFLALSPESPWASSARDRLSELPGDEMVAVRPMRDSSAD